jgi:hypothetical protein
MATQPHVKVIVGDAEDAKAVVEAASGCEAVVSALGHTSLKRSFAQSKATEALIGSLPVDTTYVTLTGFGVPDPKDPAIPPTGRIMNQFIRLVPGHMYDDGYRHVQLLRQSALNWTVIRAPRLTMGTSKGYELGYFALSAQDSVPRSDVAAAMVSCLTDKTWAKQAPMIRPVA